MANAIGSPETPKPVMLGPFLGEVTATSIKVWLSLEGGEAEVYVTLHKGNQKNPRVAVGKLVFSVDKLWVDCIKLEGLEPDTLYVYRLWTNPSYSIPLFLHDLSTDYLHFRTLPSDPNARIDFVVMSCHNPFDSLEDGHEGHAVWADMLQIIGHENNKYVRFAILGGDQMYADEYEERLLAERDDAARLRIYLEGYRKFWSNIRYRRVMACLPAVMVWDDHEIMDGWGSEQSSFIGETSQFKPEWEQLFRSASAAFAIMQAARNPAPLSPTDGFDVGFRIGGIGFLLLDLRTHRNFRINQVFTPSQFKRIENWIDLNKKDLHTLFVVSPVVFSHGPEIIEKLISRWWGTVLAVAAWLARWFPWGRGMHANFKKNVGDLRDDIRDAWSSGVNAEQADQLLGKLFALQNDPDADVSVVIMSGDIHTPGYATVYSSDVAHANRASIPHITSSSVSYKAFNWILEAVYRHASKTVVVGKVKKYYAQVSHHFCARSMSVLSVRPTNEGHQLKVKYYLEGFPEPQTLLFDLEKSSHRENIDWVADKKIYAMGQSAEVGVDIAEYLKQTDVATILQRKAAQAGQPLNYRESIVDLLKLLGQDSSLGARKRLAKELGYDGDFGDTFNMNVWLHGQVMRRFIEREAQPVKDEKAVAES